MTTHLTHEATVDIATRVNGREVEAEVPARTTLADFLREHLGLTGTHLGCEHGVCGCCNVLLDGVDVRSCLLLAAQVHGHEVTTVEGLRGPDGQAGPVQEAFAEAHGLQCGYCTPAMVVSTTRLLSEDAAPDDDAVEEALSGNICRCTGYQQIRDAVRGACAKAQAAR